jgi:hypothetical protein
MSPCVDKTGGTADRSLNVYDSVPKGSRDLSASVRTTSHTADETLLQPRISPGPGYTPDPFVPRIARVSGLPGHTRDQGIPGRAHPDPGINMIVVCPGPHAENALFRRVRWQHELAQESVREGGWGEMLARAVNYPSPLPPSLEPIHAATFFWGGHFRHAHITLLTGCDVPILSQSRSGRINIQKR